MSTKTKERVLKRVVLGEGIPWFFNPGFPFGPETAISLFKDASMMLHVWFDPTRLDRTRRVRLVVEVLE